MKTTLDLPDDLVREVKIRAVLQGRTLKEFVTELLREGLGLMPTVREVAPSERVGVGNDGLPVIRCRPDAPAAGMTVAELLALERDSEAEEDLRRAVLSI